MRNLVRETAKLFPEDQKENIEDVGQLKESLLQSGVYNKRILPQLRKMSGMKGGGSGRYLSPPEGADRDSVVLEVDRVKSEFFESLLGYMRRN